MAISMASHPTPAFINQLQTLAVKKLDNEKVYATLVASFGSVLRHALGNNIQMKQAHDGRIWLESQLAKCPNKDDECKLIFLRALKNAAQPTSIPALLKEAKHGSKAIGPAVLKTLKEIGSVYFTSEVFDTLEDIYFEVRIVPQQSSKPNKGQIYLYDILRWWVLAETFLLHMQLKGLYIVLEVSF